MKKIIYISLFAATALLTACDDLFEPAIENQRDIEAMKDEPTYAQGVLANAYTLLPYSSNYSEFVLSDLATDDAVSVTQTNDYSRLAVGGWASNSDALSQWRNRFSAIQYCNIMLEKVDEVKWAESEALNQMFIDHFKGESYALRALQEYYLLRAHAGYTANGELLGVPIHTASEDGSSDFNRPRDSFKDCVAQILADCDEAEELLAYEDRDITSADEMPAKYRQLGATQGEYNRAFGTHHYGKINGKVAAAIRAQVLLLAASPAYSANSGYTYQQAADAAARVLDKIGGVAGMDPNGWKWFANTSEIDNLSSSEDPKEIVWRGSTRSTNDPEDNYYPPSLYGHARVNPTQNLVDAFPMANGYPIAESASGYDAADPYTGRDPRLAAYIVYNGSTLGVNNSEIITATYGTNRDAINNDNGSSTRTGYYMRKHLRPDINLNPSNPTEHPHYDARIRYTEIFLAYAEAANEAYGPTADGGHGYSAYDVIKALRARAGVGTSNGDAYLESIKNDQAKMRELIRNERRLELCFENHRFYDLRRWKVDLSVLTAPAQGVQIGQTTTGNLTFTVLPSVEARTYQDYMYYGPIPYEEIVKWSALEQNAGW